MNFITLFIILSAAVHIGADMKEKTALSMVFKPLTMILIMGVILGDGIPQDRYGRFILTGLIFSFIGDIMLLKPWYKFELGLVSFLIGHLFYVAAFTGLIGGNWEYIPLLPFIGFGIWLYRQIEPKLGKVKIPVIIYMVVIIIMVWQGTGVYMDTRSQFGIIVGAGAFIFCVSDSLLAYQRFKEPIHHGNSLVLITYYIAQFLLSSSVLLHNIH